MFDAIYVVYDKQLFNQMKYYILQAVWGLFLNYDLNLLNYIILFTWMYRIVERARVAQ